MVQKLKGISLGILTLVCSLLATLVFCTDNFHNNNFTQVCAEEISNTVEIDDWSSVYDYSSNTDTITITNIKSEYQSLTHFVVPNSINGLKVASIGSNVFSNNSSVITIEIQSSTNSIKILSNAFENCFSLTSITFNSEVVFDGNSHFNACTNLNTIIFNTTISAPVVSQNSFNGIDTTIVNVYVTEDSYDNFASSMWTMFNLIKIVNYNEVCMILLENNGGEGISSIVVQKGTQLNIADPTKIGNTFVGWYRDENLTQLFSSDSLIDKSMMLYAKWELTTYELVYTLNGGIFDTETEGDIAVINYTIDSVMDANNEPLELTLDTPTKYGYRFMGWYTSPIFESEKLASISIDNLNISHLDGSVPFVVYAKWEQITYIIEFSRHEAYSIGLDVNSTNPVGHGQTLKFTLIFNEGYTQNTPENLVVSYIDSTLGKVDLVATNTDGVWYYIIEDVKENYYINIEGVKLNTYNVYFVSQSTKVQSAVTNLPSTLTVPHGQSIADSIQTPNKVGYIFIDWFKQIYNPATATTELETIKYDFNQIIEKDTTISAVWIPQEYIIDFVLNGGAMAVTSVTYTIESDFTLPFNTDFTKNITREGYLFNGWFDNATLTGEEVTQISQGTTGNITLYAKWSAEEYSITYVNNGGIIDESEIITYTVEQEVSLPSQVVRGGYTFDGWSDNEDTDKGNIIRRINVGTTGDKIFYAKWLENVYVINYYLYGNTYSRVSINDVEISHNSNYYNQEFIYGSNPDLLSSISRYGYTFDGWYTDNTYATKVTSIGTEVAEDVYLHAKWTAINFTVNLDYNNNINSNETLTFTFEDFIGHNGIINLPSNVTWDEHHYFIGWFNSDVKYININPENANNVNLIAQWSENSFELTILPSADSEVAELANIIKLVGGDGDLVKNFGGDIRFMVIIADSRYNKSNVSIKYKIDDGALSEEITRDEDNYFNINSVEGDLTVYICNLKLNTYTIAFETNGGSNVPSIVNIPHGTKVSAPNTPTKIAYKFVSWHLSGITNSFDFTEEITNDITLYAKWEVEPLTVTVVSAVTGETVETWNFDIETLVTFENMVDVPGYEFVHYEYNGNVITSTKDINESITITAKYNMLTYNVYYTRDNAYINTGNPDTFTINGANYYDEYGNPQFGTVDLVGAEKTNYIFTCWRDVESKAIVETIPYKIDGKLVLRDIVLIAEFSLESDNLWEVKYYDNERLLYTDSIQKGDTISPIETEDKVGYINTKEWYTNANFSGDKWNFNDPVLSNMSLYIKYELEPDYQITYEYIVDDEIYNVTKLIENADVINNNVISYNIESFILLQDATIIGYQFTGWYLNNNPVDEIKGLYGNITLQARFTYVTYNIMYQIENGAKNDTSNITTFKCDDSVFDLQPAIPMPNYHFVKWVVATNSSQIVTSINPATCKDYYLSAVFAENTKYVGVTFYVDGEYVTYLEQEVDTLLIEPDISKNGYTLVGWYVDDSFSIAFDFSQLVTENMSLYAYYTLNEYNITYDSNIEVTQPYPNITTFTAEELVIIPDMSNESGYKFLGWYINVDIINGVYYFDNATAIDNTNNIFEDITFVARFEEIKYIVTYELNGGVNNPQNLTEFTITTQTFTLLEPTKAGYIFTGWTRKIDNEYVTVYNIPMGTCENIILRANFVEEITKITVTRKIKKGFNAQYFINSIDTYNLIDGYTSVPDKNIEEEGYTFDGWYLDETLQTQFHQSIQYNTDQVIYGILLPEKYTITYEYNVSNTQTPTNQTEYTVEDLIILKNPQLIAGYVFNAWYTGVEKDDEGVLDFTNATKITNINHCTGNIEIVAKYDVVTYKITYFLDGGTNNENNPNSYTVVSNDIKLYAPSKEGYVFAGWVDDNGRFVENITTGHTGNINLTATFATKSENKEMSVTTILYIVASVASVAIIFTGIIIAVIIRNNKRKAVDNKRIATLIEQINTVVNKHDKK